MDTELIGKLLVQASLLTVAANALTEALAAPVKARWPDVDTWWLQYVAWLWGGGLAALAGLDLFGVVVPTLPAWAGLAMTALVTGRGANFLHDIFKSYTQPKAQG